LRNNLRKVDFVERGYKLFTAAVAALALTGCGTLYTVEVNARAQSSSELDRTYVILPGDPGVDIRTEEFQVFADQVERTLEPQNLARIEQTQWRKADLIVLARYDVSEPEKVGHSSKTPMFQRTQVADTEEGTRQSGGQGGNESGGHTNSVEASATDEFLGIQSYTFVRTVFWRSMMLRAIPRESYDLDDPAGQKVLAIWSVTANSKGSSPIAEEFVPALLAVVAPYVGTSTEGHEVEKINGTSRKIARVRDGS